MISLFSLVSPVNNVAVKDEFERVTNEIAVSTRCTCANRTSFEKNVAHKGKVKDLTLKD